jgi:hypothetical protein
MLPTPPRTVDRLIEGALRLVVVLRVAPRNDRTYRR